MKKKWEKPNLVVLLRSSPEEAVLAICKSNNPNSPSSGPNNSYDKCADGNKAENCNACTGEGGQGLS